LTLREVADEVGISITKCHEILTGKLGMQRAAKFVKRMLTDEQKQKRLKVSHL
jgi:hypothetical protein